DASRIDLGLLRHEYALPARLLGIGLGLTIAAGAALAAVVFGALTVPEAVVLSVLLAPTDAALGQAVVTDARLPSRIRQGLNVESGLNDGLCVPLLFIALAVAETDAGETGARHAAFLVVEEVGIGAVGGIAAGLIGAFIAIWGARRGSIEPDWLQVVPLASAALAYGVATPLDGSGFIAAFVGGAVYGGVVRSAEGAQFYLVDQAGEVLNSITFLLFGALLLAPALDHLSWRMVVYALGSLTLVRMVPVALTLLGTGARWPTVAFLGWFGPRGLASIVFAVIVVEESKLPHADTILVATFVTVGMSVFLHGVTASPLTNRYVSWMQSVRRPTASLMEDAPTGDQPWRHGRGLRGAPTGTPAVQEAHSDV
ncbi:MAG: sodium/hydrogen antiporter, partial [Gaiellales bacterium]|nr:sodium/hydrogen antiporter [Gaiellales bacterium]